MPSVTTRRTDLFCWPSSRILGDASPGIFDMHLERKEWQLRSTSEYSWVGSVEGSVKEELRGRSRLRVREQSGTGRRSLPSGVFPADPEPKQTASPWPG